MDHKWIFLSLLFLIIFPGNLSAQENTSIRVLTPLSGDGGVWFDTELFYYHPGDNLSWANPKLDDKNWAKKTGVFSVTDEDWTGMGWFRLHFRIDSSLMGEDVLFSLWTFGATEIYLNGEKIYELGKVGKDIHSEEVYYVNMQPFQVSFTDTTEYVMAVRYSNHYGYQLAKKIPWNRAVSESGFMFLYGGNLNEGMSEYMEFRKQFDIFILPVCTLLFILGFMQLLDFFLVHREKMNLWFGIFSLQVAYLISSNVFTSSHIPQNVYWIIGHEFVYVFLIFTLYLAELRFLYHCFYTKVPYIWYFFLAFLPIYMLIILFSSYFGHYSAAQFFKTFIFIPLIFLEMLRVVL